MRRTAQWPVILVFLIIVSSAGSVDAQIDQSGVITVRSQTPMTTNYYFAKSNEITIVVSVIGSVQKPGRYEISKSIDLPNLLALAGGPTAEGTYGSVTITRTIQMGGTIRYREVELDLSDMSGLGPSDLVLYPGDVVEVGRSGWAVGRDVYTWVVGLAIVTTAVANVIIASSYLR